MASLLVAMADRTRGPRDGKTACLGGGVAGSRPFSGFMAASACLAVSNTVAIQFHKCPTFVEASELFKGYEVARLDISFASTDRLVLVTFYDVRVAQQVLSNFKPNAWLAPEGMKDFRAVRLSSSEFADLPRQDSFEQFGEIAGFSNCGGDIVIEFYDMRAALRCSIAIPSEPQTPMRRDVTGSRWRRCLPVARSVDAELSGLAEGPKGSMESQSEDHAVDAPMARWLGG
ncbi:unnamed protein product [Durusdinium trenchii]|uniref:Uncharacterized protein n=1 Tax=Durusdinium trenchii TaxID=1381693 RepID=A0ABP0R2A3_9DINO